MRAKLRQGTSWALLVIVGFFVMSASYGMRADLPHASRSSTEVEQIYYAVKFGSGDLNPHDFAHPPLFAYLLFGCYGMMFLLGRVGGVFHSVADFERLFFTDPTFFFVLARSLVAGLGAVGLWLCYRVAQRLYQRQAVALLATAWLSVSPVLVSAAHYASSDIPMLVLALWAWLMIVHVLHDGRPWHYAGAGLLIGVATATKYNAGWLIVGLVLAHAIRLIRSGAPWRQMVWSPRLLLGMGLVVIGFLLGCPFAVLDWATFSQSYHTLSGRLMGPATYHFASYRVQGNGPWFILSRLMPVLIGAPLTVACVIGCCRALRWHRESADLLLVLFIVSFIAYLSRWSYIRPVYFIYVLPLMLMLAARWCVALTDRLQPVSLRVPVLVAVWLGLTIVPWGRVLAFEQAVAQTPVQMQARAWMEAHVPSGTAVAIPAGIPLVPNAASIQRQMDEIRAKRLGQGIQLQRLTDHLASIPVVYDVWSLPFPWSEDFDETDFDLARHRQAGVAYVLITNEMAQYVADPVRYGVQARYYKTVTRTGLLVQEFRQRSSSIEPGAEAEEFVQIYAVDHPNVMTPHSGGGLTES